MAIRSILIDDELHNLENLTGLLEKHCPEVSVIAACDAAIKGLELIHSLKPDLVFLDIEMPYKNGFELLEEISEVNFEIIFVTAYDHYILQAIKCCALDYLMKPISISELKSAINKVNNIVSNKRENQKLKVLVENLKKSNQSQKIALPTSDELHFVSIEDITHCKGENNYTYFYLVDGKSILISRTLKEWDDLLTPYGFIRTHQSFLVNAGYVKSFVKKDGGYLLMTDGSIIKVSKHKKEYTLNRLASVK